MGMDCQCCVSHGISFGEPTTWTLEEANGGWAKYMPLRDERAAAAPGRRRARKRRMNISILNSRRRRPHPRRLPFEANFLRLRYDHSGHAIEEDTTHLHTMAIWRLFLPLVLPPIASRRVASRRVAQRKSINQSCEVSKRGGRGDEGVPNIMHRGATRGGGGAWKMKI